MQLLAHSVQVPWLQTQFAQHLGTHLSSPLLLLLLSMCPLANGVMGSVQQGHDWPLAPQHTAQCKVHWQQHL